MIEHCEFGLIRIDGGEYRQDILIIENNVKEWHGPEGHNVYPKDMGDLIKDKPQIIIIGTGFNGLMQVPEKTIKFILNKGIELSTAATPEAAEKFNQSLKENLRVAAGFYITC